MDALAHLNISLADHYVIDREVARGGIATVFLARDIKHSRRVALKVLNPELGAVMGVERFLSEIRVTANLQHPNLLPLFDSGEANGLLCYVMPYVEGESLRAAGGERVTQTGLALGTPQYMGPQRATGDRSIDGRTAIDSLGAITYEMLASEPPHAGSIAQAIIAKSMMKEPRPLSVLRRSLPPHLDDAVRRAPEYNNERPIAPCGTSLLLPSERARASS